MFLDSSQRLPAVYIYKKALFLVNTIYQRFGPTAEDEPKREAYDYDSGSQVIEFPVPDLSSVELPAFADNVLPSQSPLSLSNILTA